MKIFKYQLDTTDAQSVTMPSGAEILTIQTQNDIPCIWAIVNPDNCPVKRVFAIYGTGHEMASNPNQKYIGTYQLRGGALVFHCFEII